MNGDQFTYLALSALALPYAYILSWAVASAYFNVKHDYQKRFLKNMEGKN